MFNRLPIVLYAALLVSAAACTPQSDKAFVLQENTTFKCGPGHEVVEEHWPDGALRQRRCVRPGPDGQPINDGLYVTWYPDGQKRYEATYVDGTLHGIERQWHDNGTLWTEQHFRHGSRHGPRCEWDAHGNLRKEEHYIDDQPHGTWKVWTKSGRLKWEARYEHGNPVSEPKEVR